MVGGNKNDIDDDGGYREPEAVYGMEGIPSGPVPKSGASMWIA